MATRTGWVIEIVRGTLRLAIGRSFYIMERSYRSLVLNEAVVFEDRKTARHLKSADEVVRKVELDELGRATHIIPGR